MYFDIFQKLKAVTKPDETYTLSQIYKKLDVYNFKKNQIKDLISFLIIKGQVEVIQLKTPLNLSIIKLKSKMVLDLPEPTMSLLDTELVLSIPPYNKFSILNELEESSIVYANLKKRFIDLIERAEESIKISSPFIELKTVPEIENAILQRMYEGVKVQILAREICNPEKKYRYEDLKRFYLRVKKMKKQEDLEIREYHFCEGRYVESSTHSKLLIIDDKIAYTGSGEIRKNSLDKNFELGVVLTNELAGKIAKVYDLLFSKGEVINFEDG